eukprot:755095-Hanusia_phi.AAC.3
MAEQESSCTGRTQGKSSEHQRKGSEHRREQDIIRDNSEFASSPRLEAQAGHHERAVDEDEDEAQGRSDLELVHDRIHQHGDERERQKQDADVQLEVQLERVGRRHQQVPQERRQPSAEEQVQQRSSDARGRRHAGHTRARHGEVGDEIADAVGEGEDGEAHEGVGDVEHCSERLEEVNELRSKRVDPGDGGEKAQEGEQREVGRGLVVPRGDMDDGGCEETEDQGACEGDVAGGGADAWEPVKQDAPDEDRRAEGELDENRRLAPAAVGLVDVDDWTSQTHEDHGGNFDAIEDLVEERMVVDLVLVDRVDVLQQVVQVDHGVGMNKLVPPSCLDQLWSLPVLLLALERHRLRLRRLVPEEAVQVGGAVDDDVQVENVKQHEASGFEEADVRIQEDDKEKEEGEEEEQYVPARR